MGAWLADLSERLRDWRNRRVADPAFRRRAAAFPLTRPTARREAKRLFDLSAGFVYSQVLAACVRTNLFELLAPGPLPLGEIAAAADLPEAGALRLLKAAAALDLTESRSNGRWALGSLGAAMIGNAGAAAMIEHHAMLYDDLRDPLALLRSEGRETALQSFWAYAGGNGGRAAASPPQHRRPHRDYSALMGASQVMVAEEILAAYPFRRHKLLLDVGGGDGSFVLAAAERAPELQLMLFDLTPVAAVARQKVLAAGLAGRIKVFAGSFFDDLLPAGADLVTLNRVLHDHDDAQALAILKNVRAAMAPGATLLVCEPMAETAGARAMGDAYFGFYLLAMGQGRPRRADELKRMLESAGFSHVFPHPTNTPLIVRILAARAS